MKLQVLYKKHPLILSTIMVFSAIISIATPTIVTYANTDKVTIRSHSSYTEVFTYVVGEVENTGSRNLNNIEIVATFFDKNNNVLTSDSTYTDIETLTPNQKSPFELNTYPHENLEIDHYSLTITNAKNATYIPYRDLNIRWLATHRDNWYHVRGEVGNEGTITATEIKLVATFYNTQGKVIFRDVSQADIDTLPPGGVSPFELNTYPLDILPSTYSVQVECAEQRHNSSLSCELSRETIVTGSELIVSGYLTPRISSQDIVLNYTKPDESEIKRVVQTDSTGYYEHTVVCYRIGTWNVIAKWRGNSEYVANISSKILFDVILEPPRSTIEVTVSDLGFNPLDMTMVRMTSAPEGQSYLESETDEKGKCIFNDVLVGTYTFEVSKPGYISDSFTLDVLEDENTSLIIRIEKQLYDLEIIVDDSESNPVKGVEVSSTDTPSGQTALVGTTDNNGIILFRDLVEGVYRFNFSKEGYENDYELVTVGPSHLHTRRMELVEKIQKGDLRIIIKDKEDTGISGTRITFLIHPEGQNNLTSSTIAGEYIFSDIIEGDYVLKVWKEEYVTEYIEVYFNPNMDNEITITLELIEEDIEPEPQPEPEPNRWIPGFPLLSILAASVLYYLLQERLM